MDINIASAEELQRAFEVDGDRARFMISTRNQIGGFKNWEQIKEIVPSIEGKMVKDLHAASLTIGDGQETRRERDASGYKSVNARNATTDSQEQPEQVYQAPGKRADCLPQEPANLDLWSSPEGRLILTLAMIMG